MILSLFRKDPNKDAADALYAAALEQARTPAFYLNYGVADTVEGRFELASLHVYLLLRRLKGAGDETKKLAQMLLDTFFSDMDGVLRELGVGDLSVARKIRGLAEAFFGRVAAYEAAMAEEADQGALTDALARNVYGDADPSAAAALADYARRSAAALAEQPIGRIKSGIANFSAPLEQATENG